MKIIFDCDNTMGIKGCDVDDGLALLYLLGKKNIELCGITTTYGNSDVNTVYNNTVNMLREIGRPDIRILQGCSNRYDLESDAVDFILATVEENRGNVSILATGSLTNLSAAYLKDPTLFEKVSQIVIMGGITEKLVINGKVLNELNFSCDPLASQRVLQEAKNLSIITGNNCLQAYFSHSDFINRLTLSDAPSANYILSKCGYWFEDMMLSFDSDGFYNWDVVAAVYLANPGLFKKDFKSISFSLKCLETGLLNLATNKETSNTVNLPSIKDINAFTDEMYNAWIKAYERK